jgi:rsbT co-antagonist protein RsbR
MKHELRYIGQKINQNQYSLAEQVILNQDANHKQRLDESGLPLSERLGYRAELIGYFGQALYDEIDEISEKIAGWGEKAADVALQYDISLSDTLRSIGSYRTVIWNAFTEELEQRQFAPVTMLDVSKIIDPLIDMVFSIVSEVFEAHNKRIMNIAFTALEELSVPVVPITEGIAAIPIVGDIDTHRAKLIMEVSLNEGARLNLTNVILDVSGVAMIDTMVADKLFQIVKALELTGIKTIITGIRPEIAQTITNLGLDFGGIRTRAHMQQALRELGLRQITKP